MSDRASSILGAILGVTLGGVLTVYGLSAAVDWAITRAAKTS